MDKIIENIKDPSWWFTAFLIAIISSLLAAYLKELFGILLSAISSRFRTRWRQKKIHSLRRAILFARDSTTVTLFVARFIFITLLFMMGLMLSIIILLADQPEASSFLLALVMIFILIAELIFGFNMGKDLILFNRVAAARAYELRKRKRT